MTTAEFIRIMNSGEVIPGGSPIHAKMHELSQEAIRITMEINNAYHSHEEIVALMSELTGTEIHDSFGLFPHSIPIVAKTSKSGSVYLSIPAVNFRIREV